MKTAIDVWLAVGDVGGRLGIARDKLRTLLPTDCLPELKDAIRQHKPKLLELLRLDFSVVRSDTLNTVVFWTPDEATKESLVTAGAEPGRIYTAAELEHLILSRVTAAELPLIHEAKKQFSGRLTNHYHE